MRTLQFVCAVWVMLLVTPAVAQSNDAADLDELAELDLEELLEVSISASGRPESLFEAPATVTILKRRDIERSGARTIPELLMRVPGVLVTRHGPGNFVVNIRGTGAIQGEDHLGGLQGNNVVVTLDGVPINNPLDSDIDWNALPVSLDAIEQIEIVRGPVSPIYGANAYTGVISLRTIAAPEDGRSAVHAQLGGETDFKRSGASASSSLLSQSGGSALALHLNGQTSQTLAGATDQTHRPAKTAGVLLSGFTEIDSTTRVSLQLGGSLSERSGLDYLVTELAPQKARYAYGRLAWTMVKPTEVIDALEIYYYGRYAAKDADPSDFDAFNYDGTEGSAGRTGVDIKLSPLKQWRLDFGVEGQAKQVEAPFLHPDENGQTRLGFGVNGVTDLRVANAWLFALAGRVDNSDFLRRPEVSGRASAVFYQPRYSIRVTAGNAYREPTYVELGSRIVDRDSGLILLEGAPGLDAPRVQTIELTGTWAPTPDWFIRPTVYYSRASSLISGRFDSPVRNTFANSETDVDLTGQEVEVRWDGLAPWRLHWAANVLTLTAADAATDTNAPRFSTWAGADGQLLNERLVLGGGVYLATERNYVLRAGTPPEILRVGRPERLRLDVSASYQILTGLPLWLSLKGLVYLPSSEPDSPLDASAESGSVLYGSLRYAFGSAG